MVTIKVRGPDGTVATLSPAQADACNPILVDLMNQEIRAKEADKRIAIRCEELGIPLQFVKEELPARLKRGTKK